MPVVAIAAVQLGFMLGGSIVIEAIFNLPVETLLQNANGPSTTRDAGAVDLAHPAEDGR